jgi:hypothetical protein
MPLKNRTTDLSVSVQREKENTGNSQMSKKKIKNYSAESKNKVVLKLLCKKE